MQRLAFTCSLLVVGFLIGMASTALGQPGEAQDRPGQVLSKDGILIAFNRADLTLQQMQTLQGMVQATMSMRDRLRAALDAFQAFLSNWTGSAKEFEAALAAEQQKLKAVRDDLHALWESNAAKMKDLLTARQFEIMRPILIPVMGPPAPLGQAHSDRPEPGHPGPGGLDLSVELRILDGLDLLNEVLAQKIALLQKQ